MPPTYNPPFPVHPPSRPAARQPADRARGSLRGHKGMGRGDRGGGYNEQDEAPKCRAGRCYSRLLAKNTFILSLNGHTLLVHFDALEPGAFSCSTGPPCIWNRYCISDRKCNSKSLPVVGRRTVLEVLVVYNVRA